MEQAGVIAEIADCIESFCTEQIGVLAEICWLLLLAASQHTAACKRHRVKHNINRYHSNTSIGPFVKSYDLASIWINDADLALVETQLIPIPSQPRLSSSANCSGVSMVCCRCFSDRHCDIQLAMEVKLLWLWMVVTSVAPSHLECLPCIDFPAQPCFLAHTGSISSIQQHVTQAYGSRQCKPTAAGNARRQQMTCAIEG